MNFTRLLHNWICSDYLNRFSVACYCNDHLGCRLYLYCNTGCKIVRARATRHINRTRAALPVGKLKPVVDMLYIFPVSLYKTVRWWCMFASTCFLHLSGNGLRNSVNAGDDDKNRLTRSEKNRGIKQCTELILILLLPFPFFTTSSWDHCFNISRISWASWHKIECLLSELQCSTKITMLLPSWMRR